MLRAVSLRLFKLLLFRLGTIIKKGDIEALEKVQKRATDSAITQTY